MAKIDKRDVKLKKPNKRKLKEILEADSPTSKFKKLDISMLKMKSKKKAIQQTETTNTPNNLPKKRKSFDEDEVDPTTATRGKKSKLSKPPAISHASDEEAHEPTLQEINESLKPENIKNIETVRQKKRTKHQKVVEVNSKNSMEREISRNIAYLNKWKSSRESWKFEKLRQISIQNHLFDEANIDDDLWSLIVEYLSGAKGAARECILKKSEKIINDIDSRLTDTNKKQMLGLKNYNRAREMLQLLQRRSLNKMYLHKIKKKIASRSAVSLQ